jgi:pimeloyl-ACP methyl ester carboxylesterase
VTARATLVLIHGCGTDGHFWDELLGHLVDLPVVAPSLPGRGDSGERPLASAADNAGWLFDHLERASIADVICVGHSFGGAVAIEMALRKRSGTIVVRGLGLVSTGARLRVLPEILEAVARAAETGVAVDLGRHAYRPATDPALVERVEARARRTPPATTRQDWMSTNAFDRLGQIDAISVPTAVVTGADDTLTPPRYSRYLADHIAGATLEIIEDAGHMLPVERPAELARVLLGLVDRI